MISIIDIDKCHPIISDMFFIELHRIILLSPNAYFLYDIFIFLEIKNSQGNKKVALGMRYEFTMG